MSNKLKNTRVVTLKEDYSSKVSETPIYKKGETHYIHKDLVKTLLEKGMKAEVKEFPIDAEVARAQKRKAENEKLKRESMYA